MNRILLVEDHARLAALIQHALDVALHRLRRKLRAIGSAQRIVNIRTLGYALRETPLAE